MFNNGKAMSLERNTDGYIWLHQCLDTIPIASQLPKLSPEGSIGQSDKEEADSSITFVLAHTSLKEERSASLNQ